MTSHVLVVDDDPSIRSLVGEILELADYEVETAADGAEALRSIEHCSPSVMLLDMRMPVLDGWGVAHALQEQGRHVPTVVMTAAENAEQWCAEVSADACVGKPFELEDLLRAVATVRSP
jgi:two-component system chemotaxis response regulator CheY